MRTADRGDARAADETAAMTQARMPLFTRLEIESHSNCNRACWFCPRTYDRSGAYLDSAGRPVVKRMPTERIADLLEQAENLGFHGLVASFFYSEPLLDERHLWLARQARQRGMKPIIHTNGDLLKRDDALRQAVMEVYQTVVIGLYDYETDDELEQAKRFWQDRLAGTELRFSAIGRSIARGGHSMAVPRVWVPTDHRMGIPDLTYGNAPCGRPLIRMIIRHDGEMCHCCEDTGADFRLGNVFSSSLEALWYSERHEQVVKDLISGKREKYALCRNCPQSPTGQAMPGKRISLQPRRYQVDDV